MMSPCIINTKHVSWFPYEPPNSLKSGAVSYTSTYTSPWLENCLQFCKGQQFARDWVSDWGHTCDSHTWLWVHCWIESVLPSIKVLNSKGAFPLFYFLQCFFIAPLIVLEFGTDTSSWRCRIHFSPSQH